MLFMHRYPELSLSLVLQRSPKAGWQLGSSQEYTTDAKTSAEDKHAYSIPSDKEENNCPVSLLIRSFCTNFAKMSCTDNT